jgi:hypothetical protein
MLIEYLLDQADRVSRGKSQPSMPAMLTILFERQLRPLAKGCAQPEDPGRAGASI